MKKNKIKKKYSSIQLTKEFKMHLKKIKKDNHFDSYESTIKYYLSD